MFLILQSIVFFDRRWWFKFVDNSMLNHWIWINLILGLLYELSRVQIFHWLSLSSIYDQRNQVQWNLSLIFLFHIWRRRISLQWRFSTQGVFHNIGRCSHRNWYLDRKRLITRLSYSLCLGLQNLCLIIHIKIFICFTDVLLILHLCDLLFYKLFNYKFEPLR